MDEIQPLGALTLGRLQQVPEEQQPTSLEKGAGKQRPF